MSGINKIKEGINSLDKGKKVVLFVIGPVLLIFITIIVVIFLSVVSKGERNIEKDPFMNLSFEVNEADEEKIGMTETKTEAYEIREKIENTFVDEDTTIEVASPHELMLANQDKESKKISGLNFDTDTDDETENIIQNNDKKVIAKNSTRKKVTPKQQTKKEEVKIVYVTKQEKEETTARVRQRNSLIKDNVQSYDKETKTSNVVKVYVDNDNKLVKSGYDVDLLLSEDLYVSGKKIPAYTNITGKASIGLDRIYINVESIYYDDEIIEVDLEAFEPNGTRGAKVRSGANQDIKEDVQDEVIDQTGGNVKIPIIGGLTVGSVEKKKEERGAILLDRHVLILKN
jgi:hypothetical protein